METSLGKAWGKLGASWGALRSVFPSNCCPSRAGKAEGRPPNERQTVQSRGNTLFYLFSSFSIERKGIKRSKKKPFHSRSHTFRANFSGKFLNIDIRPTCLLCGFVERACLRLCVFARTRRSGPAAQVPLLRSGGHSSMQFLFAVPSC